MRQYGFTRLFRSGEVLVVVRHDKSRGNETFIRCVDRVNAQKAVIRNGCNKREEIPASCIQSVKVTAQMAETIRLANEKSGTSLDNEAVA